MRSVCWTRKELSLPLIFHSGVLERTRHLSGDFFPKPGPSAGLERSLWEDRSADQPSWRRTSQQGLCEPQVPAQNLCEQRSWLFHFQQGSEGRAGSDRGTVGKSHHGQRNSFSLPPSSLRRPPNHHRTKSPKSAGKDGWAPLLFSCLQTPRHF